MAAASAAPSGALPPSPRLQGAQRVAVDPIPLLQKKPAERTHVDVDTLSAWFASLNIRLFRDYFGDEAHSVMRELCRCARLERLPANQVVFRQGEASDKYYVVIRGAVSMWVHNDSSDMEYPVPKNPELLRVKRGAVNTEDGAAATVRRLRAETAPGPHVSPLSSGASSPSSPLAALRLGSAGALEEAGSGGASPLNAVGSSSSSSSSSSAAPAAAAAGTAAAVASPSAAGGTRTRPARSIDGDTSPRSHLSVASDGGKSTEEASSPAGAGGSSVAATSPSGAVADAEAAASGATAALGSSPLSGSSASLASPTASPLPPAQLRVRRPSTRIRVQTNPSSPRETHVKQSIDDAAKKKEQTETFIGVLRAGGPKSTFGELGLLRDATRSASIYTESDTDFMVIEKVDFVRVLKPRFEVGLAGLVEKLRRFPLFAKSSTTHLQKIALHTVPRRYDARQLIVAENAPGAHVFLIVSGRVEMSAAVSDSPASTAAAAGGTGSGRNQLRSPSSHAEHRLTQVLEAGQMFGLKEALSNPPRPHAMSVRALEECELLAIERDDVINRMQSESIKEVMGEEKETAASS